MPINPRKKYLRRKKIHELTPDELVEFMGFSGLSLSRVPVSRQTPAMCEAAVTQCPAAIKFVRQDLLTGKLMGIAIKKQPGIVKHIKIDPKKGVNVYEMAIEMGADVLELVPDQNFTMCYNSIIHHPLSLQHVKRDDITLKDARYLQNLAVGLNGMAIKYVPYHERTDEMRIKALEKNGMAIKFIKFPTTEMRTMAIDHNPMCIEDLISRKICTEEEYVKAIKLNGMAIQFVDLDHIQRNAVFDPKITVGPYELVKFAVENDPNAITVVRDCYKSMTICQMALDNDVMFLGDVPSGYLTRSLCMKCIKEDPMVMQFVPEEFQDKELCMTALRLDTDCAKYIMIDIPELDYWIACIREEIDYGMMNNAIYRHLVKMGAVRVFV